MTYDIYGDLTRQILDRVAWLQRPVTDLVACDGCGAWLLPEMLSPYQRCLLCEVCLASFQQELGEWRGEIGRT